MLRLTLANSAEKARAFTFLELLVVMSITLIILVIVAPAVTSLYARVTIDAMSDSITEGIRRARMHADNRQSRVALCAGGEQALCTETDWRKGWTIFYTNLDLPLPVLEPLMTREPSGMDITMVNGQLFSTGQLIFDGYGILAAAADGSQGDLVLCHKSADESIRLQVFPTGQLQLVETTRPVECRG